MVRRREHVRRRALHVAAICFGAAAVAALHPACRAWAEFEIPEVDAEKGAFEAEYRGARHWGLSEPGEDEDLDLLRQSHEVELQYGLTDWWMLRLTPNVEQPDGESVELASVGVETQFVLVPRRGGEFGLALMLGYGAYSMFADDDDPDEFEFGPVVELAPGPWLFTVNPRLFREWGEGTEQEWFGFEYAAQARYSLSSRWAIAALMFGEIEDLSRAGPWESQVHVLGPSLYLFSSPTDENDDRHFQEWSLGAGVLFGLTDASPDAALRITFAVEY